MWIDSTGQDAVDLFWRLCGETEEFPRSLERPLALALPVALIKLPRLRLQDIESWMRRRGVVFAFGCRSRAARGCLIAQAGKGLLFVDGADPEDEQRFTVAHEIAHFLLDYWLPRAKVIEKFGPVVADVVDGLRPPTLTERVQAVLGSIHIGPYQSLMERGDSSERATVWDAENRADRLALALLAPPEAVLPLLDLTAGHYVRRLEAAKDALREHFGLPGQVAVAYGHALLAAAGKGPSWVESLGLR